MGEIKEFNSKGLETAIRKAWWESSGVNLDQLQHPLVNALITLCPLYQPGSLSSSKILHPPTSIEQSRVANKWPALKTVLGAMSDYLTTADGQLSLVAVFAGRGVLLSQTPTEGDSVALEAHVDIYKQAVSEFCNQNQIDLTFTTQDELGVRFPQFVNPRGRIPDDCPDANLIDLMNKYLQAEGNKTEVVNNRKNRVLLEKLHDLGGKTSRENVFWLVTGYLAFDHLIPNLVGSNGVYLATERFEPLFGISNMTPKLKELPRVHIKA